MLDRHTISRTAWRFGPTYKLSSYLPAENPEARLLQREEADRDMAALRILNAGQRELFARRLHGESNAQIAAACGRTPHAIEQSLSNIRRRLRAALGRE